MLPKKLQVPEIHIFQKMKSDLGQLGPWACNWPKTSMKIWQNCQKHAWLWEAVTHLIFIKNVPKNTGTWDRYLSENQVRFGPSWPTDPYIGPKHVQNEIEFRGGGGGCVCLWTSLQPFLGHFTFKRISNVCLHISCDDINSTLCNCKLQQRQYVCQSCEVSYSLSMVSPNLNVSHKWIVNPLVTVPCPLLPTVKCWALVY